MPSIRLDLGPSDCLAQLFSILHMGACFMLMWAWIGDNLNIELIGPILIIILFSWHNCLIKHAFKTHPQAVKQLIYLPVEQCWQLKFVNEQQIFINLSDDSIIILGISLLKFKQEGCFLRKPILISQATIGKENFRQLRKWWRQHGKSSRSI